VAWGALGGLLGAKIAEYLEARHGKRVAWLQAGFASLAFGIFLLGLGALVPPSESDNLIAGVILIAALTLMGAGSIITPSSLYGMAVVRSRFDVLLTLSQRLPPNKRLKLTAPGFGENCVCAPAAFVVVSIGVPPTGFGAAA